jgi:hypothetical protein
MVHVDTPSGRQARWETVQLLVDALWSDGFDLEIRERRGSCFGPSKQKTRTLNAATYYGPKKGLREYLSELSKKGASKGGKARAARLTKRRRKQIARMAARARWRKTRSNLFRPRRCPAIEPGG